VWLSGMTLVGTEAGYHRTVTEQTNIMLESARQSSGRSGLDISHKRDFLVFSKAVPGLQNLNELGPPIPR
jgi:hypothetical protein